MPVARRIYQVDNIVFNRKALHFSSIRIKRNIHGINPGLIERGDLLNICMSDKNPACLKCRKDFVSFFLRQVFVFMVVLQVAPVPEGSSFTHDGFSVYFPTGFSVRIVQKKSDIVIDVMQRESNFNKFRR